MITAAHTQQPKSHNIEQDMEVCGLQSSHFMASNSDKKKYLQQKHLLFAYFVLQICMLGLKQTNKQQQKTWMTTFALLVAKMQNPQQNRCLGHHGMGIRLQGRRQETLTSRWVSSIHVNRLREKNWMSLVTTTEDQSFLLNQTPLRAPSSGNEPLTFNFLL